MIVDCSVPFEQLQMMCKKLDAPVYVRRKKRTGQFGFVRRTSATIAEVERFFTCLSNDASLTNDERGHFEG